MLIKCTNISHCKTFQDLPKLGFWVWKNTIWQTLPKTIFPYVHTHANLSALTNFVCDVCQDFLLQIYRYSSPKKGKVSVDTNFGKKNYVHNSTGTFQLLRGIWTHDLL
jgi:hypothetical protein